jgi:hypothetical protein
MNLGLVFMRETRRALVLAGLAVLGWSMPAAAQLGSWTPAQASALGDTEQLKLVSAGGVVSTFSSPSVYVGPYAATLTSDPTHATFSIYCVDFLHDITVGTVWNANVSDVTSTGLSNTRLGNAGLSSYQKAIWLATQFAANQTRGAWTAIHDAIWAITTPSYALKTAGSVSDPTKGSYWVDQVNMAFASGAPTDIDYTQWRVLTDVRSPGTQEFLVSTPPTTVTPEPETYLLMITGLAGILLLAYRRRQQLEI